MAGSDSAQEIYGCPSAAALRTPLAALELHQEQPASLADYMLIVYAVDNEEEAFIGRKVPTMPPASPKRGLVRAILEPLAVKIGPVVMLHCSNTSGARMGISQLEMQPRLGVSRIERAFRAMRIEAHVGTVPITPAAS